jgi:cytochrome c peroxidase
VRLVWLLVWVTGCWTEQRVDDSFSDVEWEYLQTFRFDRVTPPACTDDRCFALARFGQQLFFDTRYSSAGIACDRCHDPNAYFVDSRADNARSVGAGITKRNAPGLVDVGLRSTYTWTGAYNQVDGVLDLALGPKALNGTTAMLAQVVRDHYPLTYEGLFPGMVQDAQIRTNVGYAIGVYEKQLVSSASPFDRYLAGETDAIDNRAKRGAALFIGKALCAECHHGPLFTDDAFHVTGLEQTGDIDHGVLDRTESLDDDGRFRTPTLRHVAKTGPYMHAGQLRTLADVIDFYRWGGNAGGYPGQKDPRIVPLEIDDDDARDLEAFLVTLTGGPVDATWATKPVLP